jgi:hypothetical protein
MKQSNNRLNKYRRCLVNFKEKALSALKQEHNSEEYSHLGRNASKCIIMSMKMIPLRIYERQFIHLEATAEV